MIAIKRIQLRYKKLSDARQDYEWQTDSELCRLDAAETLSMAYKDYLSEFTFDLCYPSSSRHEFAVETLDGQHIGNCVYYNVNQAESKVELGIMIGNRDFWNQGYGAEAVNLLLDYIFSKNSLNSVYLTTLDWNMRAHKCFKKCGFSECGELTRDGLRFIMMAIHRNEWENLRRSSNTSCIIPIKPPVN
jgi:[ribosomal protein S5]-alanine N-acetyltransferase